jgi:hypothetical protein
MLRRSYCTYVQRPSDSVLYGVFAELNVQCITLLGALSMKNSERLTVDVDGGIVIAMKVSSAIHVVTTAEISALAITQGTADAFLYVRVIG